MPRIAGTGFLLLLVCGCGGQGRHGLPPIPSPDGSMTLCTRVEQSRNDPGGYLCVIFEVRDRSGRIVHTENTRASDVMRWEMDWVADDRIRLKSSDIGTYDWIRRDDGKWVRESEVESPRGARP